VGLPGDLARLGRPAQAVMQLRQDLLRYAPDVAVTFGLMAGRENEC